MLSNQTLLKKKSKQFNSCNERESESELGFPTIHSGTDSALKWESELGFPTVHSGTDSALKWERELGFPKIHSGTDTGLKYCCDIDIFL